jgi:hypothetical protein
MNRIWMVAVLGGLVLPGCDFGGEAQALAEETRAVTAMSELPAASAPECRVASASSPLPGDVRESSGLAQSRRDPGLFWTHNDAGNTPEIYALDAEGRLVQQVRVAGAEAADWEDIESGPCSGGNCLFVGDIGDNDGERQTITVYRIPEPASGSGESQPAEPLHARFSDGPQDAEALFALPSGDLYILTKGRQGPIALYRFPSPQRSGETATLERVRELFPEPEDTDDRVTAATSSPDGRWVGVRTYRNLFLYPADQFVAGEPVAPTLVDLQPLGQSQGESLAISADGKIWLTSEAENDDSQPTWAQLQCTFP